MPCPFCNHDICTVHSDLRHVVCDKCGRHMEMADWRGDPPKKRRKYDEGTHGARGGEQRRLKTSGAKHESEHTIGYNVLAPELKRQKSVAAKFIENTAAAYQESRPFHREHIGTGTHSDYKGTGESSEHYRQYQRRLSQKSPGSAVQLNQLYYSAQPGFTSKTDPELKKADDSFRLMVEKFPPVRLVESQKLTTVPVTQAEKAEMLLSRFTARTGSYPSREKEMDVMKKFGLMPGEFEKPKKSPPMQFETDQFGIPMDGNCLFHAIWSAFTFTIPHGSMGFVTRDDLRRQAVGFLRYDPDLPYGVADHSYCEVMAQNGTWAGALEAMALAHLWGVSITIVAPEYTITFNETAHLGITIYYNGTDHYSIGKI